MAQTMNQTLMEFLNTTIREGQHNNNNNNNTSEEEKKQLSKVRELLLKGADVNHIGIGCNRNKNSSKKWTPLAYACHHGHLELTKLLLQHGANINGTQIDFDGEKEDAKSTLPSHTFTDAPLYCAVLNGHLEVVKYLLERPDINVNIVNSVGETPLYAACMYGGNNVGAAVLECLLKHKDCDVNRTNIFGETPLFAACRHGRVWIVRLLLKYRANVDQAKHGDGTTPLCIAALHEHENIVKVLIQHHANVIVKDQFTVDGFLQSSSPSSLLSSTSLLPTSFNRSIPTTMNPFQMSPRNAAYVENLLLSSKTEDTASLTTAALSETNDTITTTKTPIKKKKKQSYKSMMSSITTSSNKKHRDIKKEKEEIRKVTGGGAFSKVDKI